MTREKVRDRAYSWALSEMSRRHDERYRVHLGVVLKDEKFRGTCLDHKAEECPTRATHTPERSRLWHLARSRARHLLVAEDDLKEEFALVRKERERRILAGTARNAEVKPPAARTAEALRASRGTWLPVKDYPADGHGRAIEYARKVRLGGSPLWEPRGDFEAEIRENGDGWTVWAVWLGDGPDE